jgi:hypothetical protein
MAHDVPARLTPAEGRRFGLTVGGVFLALAAVSQWRGHDLAPVVMAGLGGTLVVAGAIIPAALSPVFRAWMAFGLLLSRVTTPLFMGAPYFLAITPMGLVMRAFGRSPLRGPTKGATYWMKHESASGHSMTRQY